MIVTAHIGENSPEYVAFKLMETIASLESKSLYGHMENPADREWVLSTFAECLKTVQMPGRHLRDR